MATCRIEGLDELIEEMDRWEGEIEPLFEEMTLTGAEMVKDAWKEAAEKHQLKDTGAMIKSIDFDKTIKKRGGRMLSYIYPRGMQRLTTKGGKLIRRKKPVRLATVAFVRHYGTKQRAATFFVDDADKLAAERIPEKLVNRWKAFLRSGR
jgi:hypothetical protein